MKGLINNFFYSIGIHIIKIIMPLLLFPVIARYLSTDGMGEFSYYQAITIIIASVIEYGYAYSAINRIVKANQNDKLYVIQEVESSRLLLSSVIITISLAISIYKHDYLLVIATMTGVLSGILPVYLFQSLNNFKKLATIELFSLLFYYTLTFSVLYFYPSISGIIISLLISRALSYFWSRKQFKEQNYTLKFCSLKKTIISLKSNFLYFFHRASVVLYSTFSIIVIKYFYDNSILGLYSSAEKIVIALCAVTGPIQGVLLPYLSRNKRENIVILFYLILVVGAISFSIITVIFSKTIFEKYYGIEFSDGSVYYNLLIWLFPLRLISSLISTDLFLSQGLQKVFSSIYLVSILGILPIILLSTYLLGIQAMIITLLFFEIILIILLLLKHRSINKKRH
ncbi:oligosaccharide flippase family protein [Providencia rettgeri]|uniref:oligosaccharide flippase family protein n=1 Tax=Providencia sp. PROV269 TaxID=2949957 RepID=UPI002349EF9D|nr:oligosaccharide flippase family protein [Providencia sp. PROV269]ELR5297350.1 oligosaccharide flippase family protein [Providencia rettgeri]MCL0016861.1 oligosaccharide flippase family protein [Providencia rettgeri]